MYLVFKVSSFSYHEAFPAENDLLTDTFSYYLGVIFTSAGLSGFPRTEIQCFPGDNKDLENAQH